MIVGGAIALWLLVSALALALCRVAALGDGGDSESQAATAGAETTEPGLAAALLSPAPSPVQGV